MTATRTSTLPIVGQVAGALMIVSGILNLLFSLAIVLALLVFGVGLIWLLPLALALRAMITGFGLLGGERVPNAGVHAGMGLLASMLSCNPLGFFIDVVAIGLLMQAGMEPVLEGEPIAAARAPATATASDDDDTDRAKPAGRFGGLFYELMDIEPMTCVLFATAVEKARRSHDTHLAVLATLDPLSGPVVDACRTTDPSCDLGAFFAAVASRSEELTELTAGILVQARDGMLVATYPTLEALHPHVSSKPRHEQS